MKFEETRKSNGIAIINRFLIVLIKALLELESSRKAIVTKAIPRYSNTNSNEDSDSNIKNDN
jgi:hypothetical protein